MNAASFRRWYKLHKWTSLICTIFLLLLCITGLPLVFHEELSVPPSTARDHSGAPASLDRIAEAGQKANPKEVLLYVSKPSDDNGTMIVITGASTSVAPAKMHQVYVDQYTASVLPPPKASGFLELALNLHTDLCAGPTGSIILFVMAVLFVISLVSGVVVYGPFTRQWRFGAVRPRMLRRARWLDLHNLLGIVTAAWMLVVGFTGAINALSPFIASLWQSTELRDMAAPFQKQPKPERLSSIQAALETAYKAEPGSSLVTIAFPGTAFASPRHYGVYLHGARPLTSRILKPLLIDAGTGELAASREMPWYVKALFISEPLHFGDYGGLPLKFLWAAFDVVAIVVLVSGIWLWWLRRRTTPESVLEEAVEEISIEEHVAG